MHTHITSPWSYWELQSFLQRYPVAVLGSGIVGLSAAIQIKTERPELPVLVLERGALPTGASTRNAGFACFGSLSELLDDRQHMGGARALGTGRTPLPGPSAAAGKIGRHPYAL